MLAYDKNGVLQITDPEAFDKWCNPQRQKHMSRLDYYNPYVQQAIEKFPNEDPILVYNQIRLFYWFNCDTFEAFEKIIVAKLEVITNIRDLSE
jgi:hypothetical protein